MKPRNGVISEGSVVSWVALASTMLSSGSSTSGAQAGSGGPEAPLGVGTQDGAQAPPMLPWNKNNKPEFPNAGFEAGAQHMSLQLGVCKPHKTQGNVVKRAASCCLHSGSPAVPARRLKRGCTA
jgi:hypothetical protein